MSAGAAPRRVALVTSAGDAGGAEHLMETLAAHADRAAVAPVLCAPEGSRLLERWASRGVEACALPPFGRLRRIDLGAKVVAEIARRFRDARIDVVHSHGVAAHIHAGLAAQRLRCPSVYHVHDLFESSWSADGALQRLALRVPADRVIAISATVAASLHGRVVAGKLVTILNGVDSDIVEPAVHVAPLIVWCGRLQRWKGAHHFIAAARVVAAARPDARFAIVGGTLFGLEPAYREQLEQQAAAAGLSDVLTFVGQVADARPWLRASTVCVHCSDRPEPFGLVMAEAMMQERPVVAFRQGGASEIVVDAETGRLAAPRDPDALAAAVLDVIRDPARAQAMGQSGRRRAERYFDAARMAASVGAVYDAVANAHE